MIVIVVKAIDGKMILHLSIETEPTRTVRDVLYIVWEKWVNTMYYRKSHWTWDFCRDKMRLHNFNKLEKVYDPDKTLAEIGIRDGGWVYLGDSFL